MSELGKRARLPFAELAERFLDIRWLGINAYAHGHHPLVRCQVVFADVEVGIGHRLSGNDRQQTLQFVVQIGPVFGLIIYLHAIVLYAFVKHDGGDTIARTQHISPFAAIEIGEIQTAHGTVLVGEMKDYLITVSSFFVHLDVIEYIIHLMDGPGEDGVGCAVGVGIGLLRGILQRTHQRISPIVVAQGIVYLALFL